MNRKQLEENIGRNVKIRLFDGEIIEGCLRKTGEEDFRNNPNLYIPKNLYFLTDGISNECRTCLFKVSHIRSLKLLEEQGGVAELPGRCQSRQYEKIIDEYSRDKERSWRGMRVKTIVNGKGEPQAAEIAIPIEGTGGELGRKAVIGLTSLINGLKTMETEQDVITHYHIICGFAACCEVCGFMTEKSTNDVMHMAEHLAENELARVAAAEKGGQE